MPNLRNKLGKILRHLVDAAELNKKFALYSLTFVKL